MSKFRLPSKRLVRAIETIVYGNPLPVWNEQDVYPDHVWSQRLLIDYLAGVMPTEHVQLLKLLKTKVPKGGVDAKFTELKDATRAALRAAFGIKETRARNEPTSYTLVDADGVKSLVRVVEGYGLSRAQTPNNEGEGSMARRRNSQTDDDIDESTQRRARTAGKKKAAAKKKATPAASKKKTAAKKKAAAGSRSSSSTKRDELQKLLGRAKGVSITEAAEKLDVTDSTVRSMIGALRASGIEVVSQGGGVFKI